MNSRRRKVSIILIAAVAGLSSGFAFRWVQHDRSVSRTETKRSPVLPPAAAAHSPAASPATRGPKATALAAKLEQEAELAAATTLRRPRPSDVPESREGHNLLFRSGGRTGSPWHILYEVRDDDGDGSPDTLCVFRIRHATSRGD